MDGTIELGASEEKGPVGAVPKRAAMHAFRPASNEHALLLYTAKPKRAGGGTGGLALKAKGEGEEGLRGFAGVGWTGDCATDADNKLKVTHQCCHTHTPMSEGHRRHI